MRIGVIVLTFRDSVRTLRCLASMASEVRSLPGTRVLLVDNASGGGYVAEIEQGIREHRFEDFVEIIQAPTNDGYASGNNLAIRQFLAQPEPPDLIYVLNNDTVLRPNAIRALRDFMALQPECGIAGSGLEDEDGTAQWSAMRFVDPAFELGSHASGIVSSLLASRVGTPPLPYAHPCDWVAGAAIMVRREVFERVGLFDEDYFLYFEDVDFCARAMRWGYQTWRVPESRVVHFPGHSTGVRWGSSDRTPYYQLEARRVYYLRNHGPVKFLAADAARLLGFTIRRFRSWMGADVNVPEKFVQDTFAYSVLRRGARPGRCRRPSD